MAKLMISLALFVCLALVHSGYALKCYSCESKMNPKCNDPFTKDKIPLNECPSTQQGTESSCLKLTTEENGETRIKRYCLNNPKGTKPCDFASSQIKQGTVKECLDCTTDECNAAGSMGASTIAVFAMCLFSVANFYARA